MADVTLTLSEQEARALKAAAGFGLRTAIEFGMFQGAGLDLLLDADSKLIDVLAEHLANTEQAS